MYANCFARLVENVNACLRVDGTGDLESSGFTSIGVLDIFGFEDFKKNSLEQLCINHANEKLQNLFNEHVFEKEKQVYLGDGLALDSLPPHQDNTPCVMLIEERRKYVDIIAVPLSLCLFLSC